MHKNLTTFEILVNSILEVNQELKTQASRAINASLTLRNWLIGLYIAEFELRGDDRATYGENLLEELSGVLKSYKFNIGRRQLYHYLAFYRAYPQIMQAMPAQFKNLLPSDLASASIVRSLTAQLVNNPKKLIQQLSYTHLELLLGTEDTLKRTFYEVECMRGNWSVRELKRQIGSLYYERSGLSKNKKKLADLTQASVETNTPELAIRDPYIFEFLGLKAKEVVSESALEDQLLDKVQEFLLELGHGFCFEARQKRILIGDNHHFVDLVFYHRILKCHVLVELKLEKFSHENIGQLNTYVSWYKKHMMCQDDNAPLGILLCSQKDHALVEYALAGMDNHIFVSKYQLELPKKEEIERFIEEQIKSHI